MAAIVTSATCAMLLAAAGLAWSQGKPGGAAPQMATESAGKAASYFYNPAGRRDPFKPLIEPKKEPKEIEEDLSKRPPLLRYDLSSLKLVGIIGGGLGSYALIETPDGKGYLVSPKSMVGRNKGVVTSINEDSIVVEEKLPTLLGKTETKTLVIKLRKTEG